MSDDQTNADNERTIGPTEAKVRELLYGPEGDIVGTPPGPAIEFLAQQMDLMFHSRAEVAGVRVVKGETLAAVQPGWTPEEEERDVPDDR